MHIPKNRKIAFIHIHRTGGTTISYMLDKFKYPSNLIVKGHCQLHSIKNVFPEYNDQFFSFSMIRNPWDRLLSWYLFFKNNAQLKSDFLTFLTELENCPTDTYGGFLINQQDYLKPAEGAKPVDVICRYENYMTDLKNVFEQLEMPFLDVPTLNHNINKVEYQKYYSDLARKKVSQLCEKDIDEFKYSF